LTNSSAYLLAQALRTERIEQHIELVRWSSGNALLVGAILTALGLYAIAWLYRREARGQVTPRMRWTLIGCRACVLALLGLIGLEPVLVNYIHRRLDACTLVLADTSASMSLADPYRVPEDAGRVDRAWGPAKDRRPTRDELVARVLAGNDGRMLKTLAAKNSVKVFTFGDAAALQAQMASAKASTRPANGLSPAIEFKPAGPATNLGLAVRSAIEAAAGSPIAGVVLLSDGNFNQGEAAALVASLLKQKGIPVYAIGVGDPAEPVNAAVTEISAPRVAFKNDPFNVTVRVAARGVGDEPISVELLESGADGAAPRVVETREVLIGAEGSIDPVVFQRHVARPGPIGYTARVAPLTHEAVASDNQRDLMPPVQILDDRMRVLLVAGAPSYDYRYLARMLERDKSVDVSCWLQSADAKAIRDGTTVITELPTKPEDLFKYDAILLMDIDPAELDPTWGSLVATFVADQGGGLLFAAGNKFTGKFLRSPNTASLMELLPVVPDADAEILLNELGHSQARGWPLVIPEQAAGDPILRLGDSASENSAIWSALDGPYWHYPVRREKPVAQVLLRHSDPRMAGTFGPHVLLATQYVGAGRTAFLGFNSTWRWRKGEERYFNRFWMQLLRYLIEGKLVGGRARCQIQTAKDQFELGDSVVVTVRALDEKFEPLFAPQLDLAVAPLGPAGQIDAAVEPRTIALVPVPGRDGYYQGRFVADRPGTTRLALTMPGSGAGPAGQKDVSVVQPDLEMQHTAMNRAGLRQLAAATGGKYFEIDEAGLAPEAIPDRSQTYVVRERPRPLWDSKVVLLILVGVLTVEWILRKKAKLL
jgi:hypothetical protein